MMSELTRLRDEASRLLTTYTEYKDCADTQMRRKVHIDLDRFLMEHRATAMSLVIAGLDKEIDDNTALHRGAEPDTKMTWHKWLLSMRPKRRGGSKNLLGNMPNITEDSTRV